jgi:hypothetical protein
MEVGAADNADGKLLQYLFHKSEDNGIALFQLDSGQRQYEDI